MDAKGIRAACERILVAANNIQVMGERNMTNLQAVFQLARAIMTEVDRDGSETD